MQNINNTDIATKSYRFNKGTTKRQTPSINQPQSNYHYQQRKFHKINTSKLKLAKKSKKTNLDNNITIFKCRNQNIINTNVATKLNRKRKKK
jgi:hypothetical protein